MAIGAGKHFVGVQADQAGEDPASAERLYQDWLARQYATYQAHLFQLLRSTQPELIQVRTVLR